MAAKLADLIKLILACSISQPDLAGWPKRPKRLLIVFVPTTLLPTTPPCWVCSCAESSQRRRCPPCSGTGSSPGGCCRHRRFHCDLRRYCSEHKLPIRYFGKLSTSLRSSGLKLWLPVAQSVSINISQLAPTIWLAIKPNVMWLFQFRCTLAAPWGHQNTSKKYSPTRRNLGGSSGVFTETCFTLQYVFQATEGQWHERWESESHPTCLRRLVKNSIKLWVCTRSANTKIATWQRNK